jgi:hypothetical protein
MFSAVVRVSGAGRLADFRERLRWLLVRDPEAEDYTEHHAEGLLEYRFAPRRGIPFPAFAEASQNFPELRVEAEWQHDGVHGRATIENGQVVPVEGLDSSSQEGISIEVADDARLVLALVCERDDEHEGDGWRGYAASAERHAFFSWRDGALTLLEPDDADEALEEVAFRLVEEWLWYDEEEAPIERARYAQYGYPVRGANLKSEKLALLRRGGNRHSSLEPAAVAVRDALAARWQNPK